MQGTSRVTAQHILKSESGMALGMLLLIMTLIATTTAIVMSDSSLSSRLNFNKTNRQIQQRADIAQNLANFILYSSAISQSVFDQSCLTTQVNGVASPTHMGENCLLHTRGQSSLDSSSPDSDDQSYYPFKLKSPFSDTLFVAGTRTDPACYGRDGALCTSADCECVYKAYTMYKQTSIPRSGLPVGGFGFSDPAINVKVKIVSTALAERTSQKQWSAETKVRLAEINSRQDPQFFNVCVQNGAVKPGYVKVAAKFSNVANNGNGSPYEEDICIPAVGAKPCPRDQFQTGVTALGEPVCSGNRNPCGANQVPVGIRDAGTNEIQIKCINAECRNRDSAVFAGGKAFGFISPKSTDTTAISCLLIEPFNNCMSRPKNSLGANGTLRCDTRNYPQDPPPNDTTCPAGAIGSCVPSIPAPPTVSVTTLPAVGPTWNPTVDPPCPGVCPPPPTLTMDDFKPAFATRAMGCVSCHATINADVITDFGYGSPWFWGQRGQGLYQPDYDKHPINHLGNSVPTVMDSIHYHNNMYADYIALGHGPGRGGSLSGMTITAGDLVIPKPGGTDIALPIGSNDAQFLRYVFPTVVPTPTPPPTLKGYIQTFAKKMNCTIPRPGSTTPNDYICEYMSNDMNFTIREVNSVYIGAPSSGDLQAIGNRLTNYGSYRFKAIQTFGGTQVESSIRNGSFSGLTNVGGVGLKGTGDVQCDGDVFIGTNLYLENARIVTKYGCRMYVDGHVFIAKGVRFPGTNTSYENLQITSSKSINLGLGDLSSCDPPLQAHLDEMRLVSNAMADYVAANPGSHIVLKRYAWWDADTRAVNGFANRLNFAIDVYEKIKGFGVKDAQCEGPGGNTLETRHVLLNAPYIMNRYMGQVEGSMIGEVVMNRLGEFPFNYDRVFTRVPVLPLLDYTKFLSIDGNNGTSPRGAAVTPGEY